MKKDLNFAGSNRCLFEEEMGIVDIVNERLIASATMHGITLRKGCLIQKKVSVRNGKILRQVSREGFEPVLVPIV